MIRRWRVAVVLSLLAVTPLAGAQGHDDAGKGKDAGNDRRTSIRLLPVRDERVGGRMVAWQGHMAATDTVDLYRTPYLAKQTFLSILVAPRQADAVFSVSVEDQESGEIYAQEVDVSGRRELEFTVDGEVYIRLEREPESPDLEYGVALWVAPRRAGNPLDQIDLGSDTELPEDFTFFISPAEAAQRGIVVASGGGGRAIWVGAVVLAVLVIAGGGFWLGRRGR